jgi:alpha-1,3-rhamnosyl/mannosyltransferase
VRVVLHGRCFQDESAFRGVGRYARGLLRGFAELRPAGVEIAVALDRDSTLRADSLAAAAPDGRLFGAPAHPLPLDLRRHPWRRGRALDARLRRLGADLLHVPAQFYGHHRARIATPCVVNVHDLTPFLAPASGRWIRHRASRLRRLARFCQRARGVIALSQHGADLCRELLGLDPARIAVIPPGVERHFDAEPRDDAATLRRHALDRPYFLYVGGDDPHKNLGVLLEAFGRFREAGPADHELVLVGRHRAAAAPADARVRRLGFVADADLPALYRGAQACISLSRFEGFALPILEAMACGTPVVAARAAALPETLGAAGLLADPDDPAEAARCLLRLVGEPRLGLELREQGLERAAGFSWERAAAATLDAYQRALGDRRPSPVRFASGPGVGARQSRTRLALGTSMSVSTRIRPNPRSRAWRHSSSSDASVDRDASP